jgi:hypothetical protein
VITINIFIVISMQAVNVYNSAEAYDHVRMVYILSGALILILVWAAIWPLYLVYQKIFLKHAV